MQSEKIKEIYVEDGTIMTSTTMVGDFKRCMWSEIAGSLIKQLCGCKNGLCAAFLLYYKWHYPKRRDNTRACMCVWWDCLTVNDNSCPQAGTPRGTLVNYVMRRGWDLNFLYTGFLK